MQGLTHIDMARSYIDMRDRELILDNAHRRLDTAARDGTDGVRSRIGLGLIRMGLYFTPQRT